MSTSPGTNLRWAVLVDSSLKGAWCDALAVEDSAAPLAARGAFSSGTTGAAWAGEGDYHWVNTAHDLAGMGAAPY